MTTFLIILGLLVVAAGVYFYAIKTGKIEDADGDLIADDVEDVAKEVKRRAKNVKKELADVKKAGESFQKLKDVGIPLAIDDFGAGYSSLSYLRDLPVDSVKLDKVFAQTISEKTTAELIKFVVSVCETLSLNMLGEGIETDDQKEKFIKIIKSKSFWNTSTQKFFSDR